jgi:hypothetical protein
MLAKGPVPRQRVLVIRVDEGPIDVEESGGHGAVLPRGRLSKRGGYSM